MSKQYPLTVFLEPPIFHRMAQSNGYYDNENHDNTTTTTTATTTNDNNDNTNYYYYSLSQDGAVQRHFRRAGAVQRRL